MRTSSALAAPRGFAWQSVIQTGAAAALLGAALLASSGVRAASPAPVVPPAPPVPAVPTVQPPQDPRYVERDAARAEQEASRAAARAEQEAARADARGEQEAARAEREKARQQREEKLRDAQERLNKAASEVAELAAARATDALDGLRAWGEGPRRSVIGVQLSSEYAGEGAKVEDVSPGGPAENAGVRAGDLIVRVNGQEIKDAGSRQLVRLLRDVKPDSKVRLRVRRDDKERDIEVVARSFSPETFVYRNEPPPGFNPGAGNSFNPFNFGFGARSELVGLEVTTLTPQLGRYFGTSKGVLVVRAPSQDTLKLQDGDVILSIDGREPGSSSHIARILSSYQPGEKLTLRVMRDQKAQDIVVTLAERAPTSGRTRTSWVDSVELQRPFQTDF